MTKKFLTDVACPDIAIANTPTAPTHGTNKAYVDALAIVWRGLYQAATSYVLNDLVYLAGVAFIYISATPGLVETPSSQSTVWDIFSGKEKMRKEIDVFAGGDMYIGEALPGSLTSAAVWSISLVTFTGQDVSIKWADGSSQYTKTWDSRATYTY